ncbi:MAG: RAMP superfamily CRISPR-associated protein [Chloroflexota bacterium]
MTLFRLRLEPRGPYATPFLADTLMGHLCWAAVRTGGEPVLTEILESARAGQPKLVLSDGFPGDLLPMPVLPPTPIPQGSVATQRARFLEEKKRRQAKWVVKEDFQRILQGERIPPKDLSSDDKKQLPATRGVLKNTINRNTGATPDNEQGGGLYELQETFQSQVTVYAQVAAGYERTLKVLLAYLAETGYGKRKSIGYGALAGPPVLEPFSGFGGPSSQDANAFVSLSTFVPAQHNPTDGYWQLVVKYGKLGEEFALSGMPFKKPLIMLRAGAVFRDSPVRDHYGRIVDGISYLPQDMARVVQYALALPVPLLLPTLPAEADA